MVWSEGDCSVVESWIVLVNEMVHTSAIYHLANSDGDGGGGGNLLVLAGQKVTTVQ